MFGCVLLSAYLVFIGNWLVVLLVSSSWIIVGYVCVVVCVWCFIGNWFVVLLLCHWFYCCLLVFSCYWLLMCSLFVTDWLVSLLFIGFIVVYCCLFVSSRFFICCLLLTDWLCLGFSFVHWFSVLCSCFVLFVYWWFIGNLLVVYWLSLVSTDCICV